MPPENSSQNFIFPKNLFSKKKCENLGKGPKRLHGNLQRVKAREEGEKTHRREVLEWEDLGTGGHDGEYEDDHDL